MLQNIAYKKRKKNNYGPTADGHKKTVVLGLQHMGHGEEFFKWPEMRVITHEETSYCTRTMKKQT